MSTYAAHASEKINQGAKSVPGHSFSTKGPEKAVGGTGSFPLQAKAAAPNHTGLPDNLKAGIENLSGYSMDDVKVHYHSAKPGQLQAHAYAQGTDIHVAPGQERHLPHEAWHVVQQKQGRVKPTRQLKAGFPINDNEGLEQEADRMGTKALAQPGKADTDTRQLNRVGVSGETGNRPVQRRIGFEFQTNIKLRDAEDHSPAMQVPLFEKPTWHIECDQGDIEFVTEPHSDYDRLATTMHQIVAWANQLAQVQGAVSEDERQRAAPFLESEYEDEVQIGQDMIKDAERRPLNAMPVNEGTDLEDLVALGPAAEMTAAPQTTIGVPMEKIISALHLVAAKKIKLGEGTEHERTVSLGAAQEAQPTLVSAHDATVTAVNLLRRQHPEIEEAAWRKLEGIVGLMASYIRTANIPGRAGYSYIKQMAPMMSRVNFSALYTALPAEAKPYFTPQLLATASGIEPQKPLFGPKKALKDVDGPTVEEWALSVRTGHDALSTLGIGHGYDSERVTKDSESMGQYNALDTEDPVHRMPLAPIELREMSKSVPVFHWPELAQKVMVFYQALLKAKFF